MIQVIQNLLPYSVGVAKVCMSPIDGFVVHPI